jgi:hypothetical protein
VTRGEQSTTTRVGQAERVWNRSCWVGAYPTRPDVWSSPDSKPLPCSGLESGLALPSDGDFEANWANGFSITRARIMGLDLERNVIESGDSLKIIATYPALAARVGKLVPSNTRFDRKSANEGISSALRYRAPVTVPHTTSRSGDAASARCALSITSRLDAVPTWSTFPQRRHRKVSE